MSKLEERESRRKSSVVGSMVDSRLPEAGGEHGRPKVGRETRKQVSLSILPSLYEDIRKIAYVQRRSISELASMMMEEYRDRHKEDLAEYERLKK